MITNLEGLAARDAWLYVAHAWPELQTRLIPGDGAAGGGAGDPARAPIDVAVSDLMREIEDEARFYARVLLDEVPPAHGCDGACHGSPEHRCECVPDTAVVLAEECPDRRDPITTSTMPGLLVEVATRYGHFTEQDDRIALDFCDAAHEAQRKVHGAIQRPAPPRWVGPCPTDECDGDLRAPEGTDLARCRVCGTSVGPMEWRALMFEAFEQRVMTRSEIVSALTITRHEVKMRTLDQWITRRRMVAVGEIRDHKGNRVSVYRFADAWNLAEASAVRKTRHEGKAA